MSTDPRELMRYKSDLSANNGRLILMEYMEEYPPLLMNMGMATRIRHFYRKQNTDDTFKPENPEELDGEVVELEQSDQVCCEMY